MLTRVRLILFLVMKVGVLVVLVSEVMIHTLGRELTAEIRSLSSTVRLLMTSMLTALTRLFSGNVDTDNEGGPVCDPEEFVEGSDGVFYVCDVRVVCDACASRYVAVATTCDECDAVGLA